MVGAHVVETPGHLTQEVDVRFVNSMLKIDDYDYFKRTSNIKY